MLSLDAFIPYRLSYTSNRVSAAIARIYAKLFGLTIAEWRLIAVTAEHDGLAQAELVQRTGMDKVTVSRAAIALTARGLLARAPHDRDRRSHRLTLTAEGRALYAQVAPKALELEAEIFGRLPADEVTAFVATLRKIDAFVEE